MKITRLLSFIVISLVCFVTIHSCKARVASAVLESSHVNASSRPLPSNLVFQETILAPMEDHSKNAPNEEDGKNRLRNAGISLDSAGANITSTVQLNGERVFFLKESNQIIPVASVTEGATYQWSQITNASLKDHSVQYSMANIFVRHVVNQDPYIGVDPNYFVYLIDGKPVVIRMTDHIMMNDHFEFRSGNIFYSETKKRLYEFEAISPYTWLTKGNIDNGYICSGSILWHPETDPNTFYSATRQYGTTQVYKWAFSAGLLHFKESVNDTSAFQSKINAAQTCPGRDEDAVTSALAKASYYVSSNVASNINKAVPIEKLKAFATGTRVTIGDTIYAVLFATSKDDLRVVDETVIPVKNPEVYVTNLSQTLASDHGKPMGHVYKWYQGTLTEVATTDSFLVALANQIHKLSLDRITATQAGIKSSDAARWHLALAEEKAATVDTAGKLAVSFITFAVCDAAYNALEQTGKKVLGMAVQSGLKAQKNALQSIAKIDLYASVNASTQMAAVLFLTGIQGIYMTLGQVQLGDDGDRSEGQRALAHSLNSTPMLGLRGFFPSKSNSYIESYTSGLAMRWGPVSAQQKANYEQNQNLMKLANINPATATKISSTYTTLFDATRRVLNVSGPVGVLIADVISGQATPSRVVGGSVEIATVFLLANPVIRPFAAVLAKQTNSMLQLAEATIHISTAGEKLDDALAVIQLQRAARDALLWFAREVPHQVQRLNPVEQAYLVATVEDPYLLLRAYYAPEL